MMNYGIDNNNFTTMKKNNIFRHEINESIQANAALNCIRNRNTPKKLNESADEKYAIAKQVMANYNPDTDELEDPTAWLLCAIQERIGKLFLKMPKKEVKSWKQAIDATIHEYELEKEQEEHSEDADRLQSQLANAWDEGMEDDEDDYVPYNNTFDETHHDIVDSILDEVHRYFQFETDVEGFNLTEYTDEQIGKAIEQILDKTDDFPSSVSDNVCYAWVKKYAREIIKVLERGSLENPYEGHPEFDFSEQEESFDDAEDFISNVVNLMEDEGMIDNSQWDAAYYTVEDMVQSNPNLLQYPSYMQFLNVFGDDILSKLNYQEQEEMPQMERNDMILALTQYLEECWIDDIDDGDLDELYYAVAKVLDRTGDYPASTNWEDCKPWCEKHRDEVVRIFLGGGF